MQDRNVGNDAWHRTGVLTFDGNVNLEDKVTYMKIQKHLGEVYGRHFGYGTVFELCVPRNKHRRSSKRYRDLAKVTSRRARRVTTRTDYVNNHPSVLQTASYNFTQTNTTPEVCVGVVKAVPIHKKNPTQHFSDLLILSVELQPVFHNKEINCIRVDSASDEGPGHELVQYWWTEWRFWQKKVVTLVTTCCSGSLFLN